MRFRKLRIAWSVFWGVACVLLIVLCVRSYSWVDSAGNFFRHDFASMNGNVVTDDTITSGMLVVLTALDPGAVDQFCLAIVEHAFSLSVRNLRIAGTGTHQLRPRNAQEFTGQIPSNSIKSKRQTARNDAKRW